MAHKQVKKSLKCDVHNTDYVTIIDNSDDLFNELTLYIKGVKVRIFTIEDDSAHIVIDDKFVTVI